MPLSLPSPARAGRFGLFVTGTDTGVGKTHVALGLIGALHAAGRRVCARKPVETGWSGEAGSDAGRLRGAAGAWEPLDRVCRWHLEEPVSPALAARRAGIELSIEGLAAACAGPSGAILVVEGAGGLLSPIADDGFNADLACTLGFPVLLVAADRLGAVNHTLLTLEAMARRALPVAGVVLNAVQPVDPALTNHREIRRLTGLDRVVRVEHGRDAAAALEPLLRELGYLPENGRGRPSRPPSAK